jgi:hypothetical protein
VAIIMIKYIGKCNLLNIQVFSVGFLYYSFKN